MLSISGAMTAGDGLTAYFTGAEDYYLSSPGQWQGQGAAALGLAGVVSREQFGMVAAGYHPGTAKQLVTGKNNTKQAGNDLTFSAPKSVSIASVFDHNIVKLHEKAVNRVVDFTEKNHICARRQVDGRRQIEQTGKMVAAKFTHSTSRELDPQLHTHVFAFNLTQRKDGKWRALYNRLIFKDKKSLGKLYRNELAKELSRSGYDIEITDRREGFFRLKNVPIKLEDHFSQRRQQIINKVNDPEFRAKYPDADKATLYQIAALGTRAAKRQISAAEIKDRWLTAINKQGYSVSDLSNISKTNPQISKSDPGRAMDQAARALTETDSILHKTKTLAVVAGLTFGQHSLSDLNKSFKRSSIVKIQKSNGRDVYTTPEMLAIEQGVIDKAKAGIGQRQAIASTREIAATIKNIEQKNGWQFTSGQKQAIKALAQAPDKVLIIQGDAGSGKTASLAAFNNLAQKNGYNVRGLGFTGKSASELEKGAGIQSITIDSFLQSSQKTANKEVWLVDESSMAGSRHYAGILDSAKKAEATVAFIGDRKQFGSIAAGNMFFDLQKAIGTHAQLTKIMRQKTEETRGVVFALNQGKNEQAFDLLKKQGNLKEYKSKNDLRRAAVQYYIRFRKNDKNAVVISQNNSDKQQLNKEIKKELVRNGIVDPGWDHTVLSPANVSATDAPLASAYKKGQSVQLVNSINDIQAGSRGKIVDIDSDQNTITFECKNKQNTINTQKYHKHLAVYNSQSINLSPRDKVIFLKNDKHLGVKNGQTGTVKSVDQTGNIVVKTGKKTIRFSLNSKQGQDQQDTTYPYIDHAMAMTAHKTQGITVENVIWHAPVKGGKDRQINRQTTYVAATRAKDSFVVLTDDKNRLQTASERASEKDSVLSILEDFRQIYKQEKMNNEINEQEHEQHTHRPKVDTEMEMEY